MRQFLSLLCRLHRVISVSDGPEQYFRDVQEHTYSVLGTAWVMQQEHGDPLLLVLQVIFVVCIPLLKWWATVLTWWCPCSPRLAIVETLQPWDMRDVFLVTLCILCSRVPTTIRSFSQVCFCGQGQVHCGQGAGGLARQSVSHGHAHITCLGDGTDSANFVRFTGPQPLLPHLCPVSVP